MTVPTKKIVDYLDRRLEIAGIEDDSCNGLQVAGRERVSAVALAVDASLESYRRAVSARCQMLIVHHGLIWKGITAVRGRTLRHLRCLLDHELNLYGAHLPLDLHPEIGHNIRLARELGLSSIRPFGQYRGRTIGFTGRLAKAIPREELAARLAPPSGDGPALLATGKPLVRTIGIVSGGGGKALSEAAALGLDCFLTGEKSYANLVEAGEEGINVIYLGHYRSETPGLLALAGEIRSRFGLRTVFLDLPQPLDP